MYLSKTACFLLLPEMFLASLYRLAQEYRMHIINTSNAFIPSSPQISSPLATGGQSLASGVHCAFTGFESRAFSRPA